MDPVTLRVHQINLQEALSSIPYRIDFNYDNKLRDHLYKILYYGASNNGEFLKVLFPSIEESKLPPPNSSAISVVFGGMDDDPDEFVFYGDLKLDLVPIHTGRPCSRKFKQGEAIYRCDECGFDETCVLCSYCFNPADHEAHNVTVSIASASNEGICDCGDPEAWKKDIHCKCETKATTEESEFTVHPRLVDAFRNTIEVVLDYIIDVMLHQNHTLPKVHESFKSSYKLDVKVREASDASSIKDFSDYNSEGYSLVLWNDEFHNYPDATSRIQAVLECSDHRAQEVATKVDREGRTILLDSYDISYLVKSYYVVQRTGLTATIHSNRDIIKQEIAKEMVSWLDELINFPNWHIQSLFRQLYCETLTSKYDNTASNQPYFLTLKNYELNLDFHLFREGLLTDDNKIPASGFTKFADDVFDMASLKSPYSKIFTLDTNELSNSRLQYLLYFDVRFWKKFRKSIHNIITPVLLANLSYKPVFALQFVEIYPHLINNMANLDREWLLNILNDATIQLFTCPKTSLNIIKKGRLMKIIPPIIELFEKNRSVITDSGDILWRKKEVVSAADHSSRAIWTTQRNALKDLVHLIEHPSFTIEHLCIFELKNVVLLILLMKRFQSNWKIKRKEGEHVLRESTEFATYFEINSLICELIRAISQIVLLSYAQDPQKTTDMVKDTILLVNNYLQLNHCKEKLIDQGDFNIIDFRVAKSDVGFMNPLNSFLSYLLEYSKVTDFELLNVKITSFSFSSIKTTTSYSNFLKVSDISLRSLVLCSQIKMGFWVRNGVLVGRQEALYRSSLLSEGGLFRDIHLQQISIMVDPSLKRSLFNFLDRYDLLNWFLNVESLENSLYEEKIFYAFEEFITFLYNVYTYRMNFKVELTEPEKELLKIKSMISYSLCLGPAPYSQLADKFPNEVISHPSFDPILEELADFHPPQGLSDTGLYRLKPSVFKTLDPLSMFVDSSDVPEVAVAIRQELANLKKVKSDQIVIKPEIMKLENNEMLQSFSKIDLFVRTQHFAKLLYKLLQTAIDSDNESFLPALLHLIHAIVIDEQFESDSKVSLKSFSDIPITNLLLTVSESTSISKSNVQKAGYLLDLFVSKDEGVIQSLVDSFGEEHISSYKLMKEKNGGGFETREERKKRLAKERLLKIKKRFEKQQSKFASKNMAGLKSVQDVDKEGDVKMKDSDDVESEDSLRTCILCQMEESNTEIFGYPCYVNKTAVFWQLPTEDQASSKLALNEWTDQRLMDDTELSYGKHIIDDINSKKRKRTNSHDSDPFHQSINSQISDDVMDDDIENDRSGESEDDNEPVEVIFDQQFVDDHGNILRHPPPGIQNYIPSLNPSRRESNASELTIQFGEDVSKRFVASSCSHGMHYRCFKESVRRLSSFNLGFQCPLCRSLNNMFVPSFVRPSPAQEINILGETITDKYNHIVAQTDGLNNRILLSKMFTPELLFNLLSPGSPTAKAMIDDFAQIIKENEALGYIYADGTPPFCGLQSLSILIGNTFQLHEISSRILTKDENMNSISVSNSQSLFLLSLVQFRVLFGALWDKLGVLGLLRADTKSLSIDYQKLWQEKFLNVGMFSEFLIMAFQCNESIQTLARVASTKMFTIVLDSLLERCSNDESFMSLICIIGDEVEDREESLTGLKTLIIEEVHSSRNFSEEVMQNIVDYFPPSKDGLFNSFLIGLQYAITRTMLPFYRQFYVFLKVLNPEFKLSTEFTESSTKYSSMRKQIAEMSSLLGIEDFADLPDLLLVKTQKLELNVFENVLRSKIPKFLDDGILSLDYPGVIKLIDLPSHLNKFLNMSHASASGLQLQYSLCLLCGEKVHMKGHSTLPHDVVRHFYKECDRSAGLLCVLFNPFNNILTVILQLQTTKSAQAALEGHPVRGKVFKYILPSPYLNKHGESNFRGGSFNGVLNEKRYNELNNLWLNQGIYAFLSRLATDSRNLTAFTDIDPFTTGTFVPDERDEGDLPDQGFAW